MTAAAATDRPPPGTGPAAPDVLAPVRRLMPALHGGTPAPRAGFVEPLVVADPTGWLPAVGLINGAGLERILASQSRSLRVPPHVSATLLWKAYAYWLVLPAVAGYLGHRRVPVLSASNMLVRVSRRAPRTRLGLRSPLATVLDTDPAAGQPHVRSVPDEAALLRSMREAIVDRHLRPLADCTHALTRVGERLLWGSLASAVCRFVGRAPGLPAHEALAVAGTLLRAFEVEDLMRLGVEDGAFRAVRRTCCMVFKVTGRDTCDNCPIRLRTDGRRERGAE